MQQNQTPPSSNLYPYSTSFSIVITSLNFTTIPTKVFSHHLLPTHLPPIYTVHLPQRQVTPISSMLFHLSSVVLIPICITVLYLSATHITLIPPPPPPHINFVMFTSCCASLYTLAGTWTGKWVDGEWEIFQGSWTGSGKYSFLAKH